MSRSSKKPRVFLLANARKPAAVEAFGELTALLKQRGILAGSDLNGDAAAVADASPDFVIALGGDGTILHAGQAMQQRQVPIIGVNMGKLGYLADFDIAELQSRLDELLTNEKLISHRMMFDVCISTSPQDQCHTVALNDCVIRVGSPFRTLYLEFRIDDRLLCTLAGDGVILATPTGSTAHNLSCGGPIVEAGVQAIIMTPIAPHSFTHRPVLISPDSTVTIAVGPDCQGAAAVLDGQSVCPLSAGSRIVVCKSKAMFQLLRNPARTPWETLIKKLKWGQDVT